MFCRDQFINFSQFKGNKFCITETNVTHFDANRHTIDKYIQDRQQISTSALLFGPAVGISAILIVSGLTSARCRSNFEKKNVIISIIFFLFRSLIAKTLSICFIAVILYLLSFP